QAQGPRPQSRTHLNTESRMIRSIRIPSSLGSLTLHADDKGLVALDFPGNGKQPGGSSALVPSARDPLGVAARALRAYFADGRPLPRLPKGARGGTAFQRKVWAAIERIPFGKTKSYGEIAAEIGSPGAAREVGAAC